MSSYDSYEPRSKFGLYVFLAFILAALIGVSIFFTQCSGSDDSAASSSGSTQKEVMVNGVEGETSNEIDPFNAESGDSEQSVDDTAPKDTVSPATPEQTLVDAGMGVSELNPETLLKKIGQSLEDSNLEELTLLLGGESLTQSQLKGLQALSEKGDYRLSAVDPFTEIGELEANRRSRWALNLEPKLNKEGAQGDEAEDSSGGEQGTRIYFDLLRDENGKWAVEKLKIPEVASPVATPSSALFSDSLGVTDSFLQAVLAQNFDEAKSFVDSEKVSDAKIAGLCIIFEEARYQLRASKPLRAMFNRELTAGFVAHVQDESGAKAADFGMTLARRAAEQPWLVNEVNLDSLLADYADRVAGGDVHFTPLVKNPAGGDTLILYFGFDEDGLTPRTERQLDIVAGLLKLDPSKKLTLSGHTDALGSDEYNERLSGNRAGSVEKYLLSVGVPPEQIIALAEGEAKPRRPNSTEDGEDNPTGRRANRRTEIYLDF